jgi:hypothetical protein
MNPYLADVFLALIALAGFAQAGGWLLVVMRMAHLHILEWLGAAFTLGVGLVGLQLLVLAMSGVELHLTWVAGFWLVAWATLAAWQQRTRRVWALPTFTFKPPRLHEAVIGGAVALTLAAVIFRATFHPIFEWDSWAIWDLKAKAFFYQRGLFPYITDTYYGLSHLEYPLLYPLAVTFIYLVLGRHSDIALLVPAMLYACAPLMLYGALRRNGAGRGLAGMGAAALIWIPNFLFWSQNLNADGPLAIYVLASTLFAADYLRQPRPVTAWLAGIFAGMTTQLKIEGAVLVIGILPFVVGRALARREARAGALLFLSAWVGIGAPWFLFQRAVSGDGGHLTIGNVQKVIANWNMLPAILREGVNWLADWNALGGYMALGPVLIVLVALGTLDMARSLWLVQTLMAFVPSALFFLVFPQFITSQNFNRYLVVFLVVGVGATLAQAVAVWQRGGWRRRLGQAVLGIGAGLMLFGNVGPDVLPEPAPSATYTARPLGALRYALTLFPDLLPQFPHQRRKLLDAQAAHPTYAELLHIAQTVSTPEENVALWVAPENLTNNFLLQRSYYLLYPRKVFLVASAEALAQVPALGAVVRYSREDHPPGGMPVFMPEERFGVHRQPPTATTVVGLKNVVQLDADFAEGIRLISVQPVALTSEEAMLIAWWHALQDGQVERQVFVHARQGDTLISQHDSPPALGTRATSAWQAEEWIADAHPLTLPSGSHSVRVCIGLYQPTEGTRLLLTDGSDMLCRDLRFNP